MVLNAILDELIPPSADGRIPGAGQLGVASFFATASAYAPHPTEAVRCVLDYVQSYDGFQAAARVKKIEVLKQAETQVPEAFQTLIRLTYMGYYSRSDTRPYFGVGAHPTHPTGYDVEQESDTVLADLTAPVRQRGKVYRDGA